MSPLAAVTRTRKVLFPATRPVRPVMATAAPASLATAETLTAVVPAAMLMVLPFATSLLLILKVARLLSAESTRTFSVTV